MKARRVKGGRPSFCAVFYLSNHTLELKGPGDDWSVQSSPISSSHARALHFYNNIKAEEGT